MKYRSKAFSLPVCAADLIYFCEDICIKNMNVTCLWFLVFNAWTVMEFDCDGKINKCVVIDIVGVSKTTQ